MSEKLAPVYPDQQAQNPQYPQNPPPYDQQQAQYPQPSQYPTYVQQQPTVITVPGVAIGTTGNCKCYYLFIVSISTLFFNEFVYQRLINKK